MCGIYGWQWKKNNRPTAEKRAILAATLGYFNDSRGGDSWGFYVPEDHTILKKLGNIAAYARALQTFDSVMAHTRKATKGDKTEENSHPFVIGKVIGAHNGVVYNSDDLDKEVKVYPVDSQHIFHSFNEGKGLDGLRGYGAIEWTEYDRRHEISLLRASSSADLAFCETGHGLVWSSKADHLKEALAMAGIGKTSDVRGLAEGLVHKVVGGRLFATEQKLKFQEQTYHSGHVSQVYGSQYSWQRDFEMDRDEFHVSKSERKTIGKEHKKAMVSGFAFICRSCYREVDLQRRCPRGHTEGVLVMREIGAGSTVAQGG